MQSTSNLRDICFKFNLQNKTQKQMPPRHVKLNAAELKEHFDFHGKRIEALRILINAIIKTQSISIKKCANAAQSNVLDPSNERRFERLMTHETLDPKGVSKLIAQIINIDMMQKHVLIFDRTYWMFGQKHVNILTLAIVYNNVAIPLFIELLGADMPHGKKGNSSINERMSLLNCYIKTFGKDSIKVLLGDREFMGYEWITRLKNKKIPYVMRMKEYGLKIQNREGKMVYIHQYAEGLEHDIVHHIGIKTLGAEKSFKSSVAILKLTPDIDKEIAQIKDQRGAKNTRNQLNKALKKESDLTGEPFVPKPEVIALCYSKDIEDPCALYLLRWKIETLFRSLKTGGFNIENTAVMSPKRTVFLMRATMIALTISFAVGVLSDVIRPIPIKKHGFKSETFVQRGLAIISTFFGQYPGKQKVDITFKKILKLVKPWRKKPPKYPTLLNSINDVPPYAV